MAGIKKGKILLHIIILICAVYCLIFKFDIIKQEIMTAITMWVNIIVPSVFPYTIISQYISDSQIVKKLPGKFISFIFGIHSCSIKAIISSVFCGYPSGAVCARSLYEMNEIDSDEAGRLICFTNNAGPLFLISAVGTGLLGSTRDGAIIYLIQLMSSFAYGILIRKKLKSDYKENTEHTVYKGDFCSYVRQGVSICVNICGFMVISYVMAAMVYIILIDVLKIQDCFYFIKKCVNSFFELSAGVKELSTINSENLKFALICSAVSWSGFSVIMQIKSVAGEIIETKRLIKAKFIQAVFSFIMGFWYKSIFSQSTIITEKNIAIPFSIAGTILISAFYLLSQKSRDKKIHLNFLSRLLNYRI